MLLLANSEEIENKIADPNGRAAKLLKEEKPPRELVEELYLTAYSRRPTGPELNRTLEYLEKRANKQLAAEDVLWVLINSKEFMFNH